MWDAGYGLPRTKQAKFAEHPFHALGRIRVRRLRLLRSLRSWVIESLCVEVLAMELQAARTQHAQVSAEIGAAHPRLGAP